MWTIIFWFIVFWGGFLGGYVLHAWMTYRMRDYSGTLIVDTDDLAEKTVYSLVLDEYPEKLEFKKEVVFKVNRVGSPRKNSSRR